LTFQIRQNYPAPVGCLPEPDFCQIWKKCRIPAGEEIWYSPISGTSAQLGYTVPFTLAHAGKYRTEDKLTIQKLNMARKSKQYKTQQNKTTLA